ncbi:hypothetical protein ACPPVQ_18965 [Diaminobutyricibacter sp. McL0618]|uniref:hypothetical protein n=1 Tax=Leifsonia sp. McL0618 TaxID=3415677 RepID=UPI003CF7C42D
MPRSTLRRAPSDLGTVRLERSGRYRAYYRFNGELFNAPRTFETRADALAWLAGERSDRRRGTYLDPRVGRDTLADYAATWLQSRPVLAPRTRDQYEHSLTRWILPRIEGENGRGVELGAYPLADMSPAVVRAWRATSSSSPGARRAIGCGAMLWALQRQRTGRSGCDRPGDGSGDRGGRETPDDGSVALSADRECADVPHVEDVLDTFV